MICPLVRLELFFTLYFIDSFAGIILSSDSLNFSWHLGN